MPFHSALFRKEFSAIHNIPAVSTHCINQIFYVPQTKNHHNGKQISESARDDKMCKCLSERRKPEHSNKCQVTGMTL
jgi:hypothetical protein